MNYLRRLLAGAAALIFCTSCMSNKDTSQKAVTRSFTVLMVSGEDSLLVGSKEDGSGGPSTLSAKSLVITGPEGDVFPFEELHPGHIIDVTWDGLIAETYPSQIFGVQALSVTGEQSAGWVNPIDGDPFFDSWRAAAENPRGSAPVLQLEYTLSFEGSGVAVCRLAAQGSTVWSDGEVNIVADSPYPLDWAEERIPQIAREGALDVALRFGREPESFVVRRWNWSDLGSRAEGEILDIEENLLPVPAKGEFLYEISASWEEGTVSYLFAVRNKE